MRIVEPVSLSVVQAHEERTRANVRVGGYHMDKCCPLLEVECYRVELEEGDIARLLLLGGGDFLGYTAHNSCRVADMLASHPADPRVDSFTDAFVDLRMSPDLAILAVTIDIHTGPLVIYDGNHRIIAQRKLHQHIAGVSALVSEHSQMGEWGFMPPSASSRRAW